MPSTPDSPLVHADNLSKKYCRHLRRALRYGVRDLLGEFSRRSSNAKPALREGEFWALEEVSFDLHAGQSLAVLGANGCGKTTLLRVLTQLIKPDAGSVELNGSVVALLELGAGFHPVLTGRENIRVNAALLGMHQDELSSLTDEIIAFSELESVIDTPVQFYSTGMSLRLGFAIAAHMKPDLLLIDEVLAVGDVAFQRKCLNHLSAYLESGGALIIISHSPLHIHTVCDRALLLDGGRPVFLGTASEGLGRYFDLLHIQEMDALGSRQIAPADGKPPASVVEGAAPRGATESEVEAEVESGVQNEVEVGVDLADDSTEVVIERLEVGPRGGEPHRSGEDLEITLHYRSRLDGVEVFWGFAIFTDRELSCVTCEMSEGKWTLRRGSGSVRCTITKAPLLAGTYTVNAFIVDRITNQPLALLGWEGPPPQVFRVQGERGLRSNVLATLKAAVKVDVCWHAEG